MADHIGDENVQCVRTRGNEVKKIAGCFLGWLTRPGDVEPVDGGGGPHVRHADEIAVGVGDEAGAGDDRPVAGATMLTVLS